MKHAEDFRDAFGSADEGFVRAVQNTLDALNSQDCKLNAGKKHIYLFPAIAMIMILTLGIGIAATNNRWGIMNWLSENRGQSIEQQVPGEIAEPFTPPVDMDYATITVREAQNDSYGMYLSVAFKPKKEGALCFNWSLNPFQDGPEGMGLVPDRKGQTLAEWAVQHGYHQLIRVGLFSVSGPAIPKDLKTAQEITAYLDHLNIAYQKTNDGGITYDQLSRGPAFDSIINNRTVVEEDGTTLIMVAGNSILGQTDYSLQWSAVPCLMKDDGTWNTSEPYLIMEDWRQGTIHLSLPVTVRSEPFILAEYRGEVPLMDHSSETTPVIVRLVRTELNDYMRIECADIHRSFQTPWLYWEDDITRFADAGIYSYAVQESNGMLLFTAACQLPDELPARLVIRWLDSGYIRSTVVVKVDN